ncbi:hypothetical protein VTN77DRAFT_4737 [Rasamsonia byssochlamydoides]|uniref:uncharacterized protein n=1 Tax=Rasamsonia byssochlamydoides TaxID=89139 RepID=UPI0037426629
MRREGMDWLIIFTLLAIFAAIAPTGEAKEGKGLPVVDLGYERHRAISLDSSGIYNFSNIRYAAPPVGDLRWRAPVSPGKNTTVIQNGEIGRICPQAEPLWSLDIAPAFVADYLSGMPYNGSTNISSGYTPSPPDPRTTEDCLFLDVLTPKKVLWDWKRFHKKAPVLVWIYGGAYVAGDKTAINVTGLVRRSMADRSKGIVFVAINYRVGAFGWLAGTDVEANGVANAGLYDQRFALEWVSKYIHLFGGDPKRVTVMGESAGAGSILHQITAYGGQKGLAPFQRAILQSPGFFPVPYRDQQDDVLQDFLQLLGVNTIEDARKLPSEKLISANAYQVGTQSTYGTFVYGPVVDERFVPSLPGDLLWGGGFDRNVEVMVGHNADEGLTFTSPNTTTESGILDSLQTVFPDMMSSVVRYILNDLYPPVFNGIYGYTDLVGRASLIISDFAFQCNTDYLNRAFNNRTYSYMFSIPPALHAQDMPYTFFNGGPAPSVKNTTVALVMQDYITSFVESGTPRSSLGPMFPQHGDEALLVNLGESNITIIRDPTANMRCRWWQMAPY